MATAVPRAPRTRYRDPVLADLDHRLGLGTLGFSTGRPDAAFALLDTFVELGGRLVDTAAVYGDGESERVIGAWLRARPEAARVVAVLTKGAHPDAAMRSRMTPELIAADLEASLERLALGVVDVYLVHRDDPAVPVGEILGALDGLVRAGRTRAIGVSNWTLARLDEALGYATAHDLAPVAVSSSYLGLAEPNELPWAGCVSARDPATLAWHARTGVPLLAWSAQSSGFFAEGFDAATASADTVRAYVSDANAARRARAGDVGTRIGATTAQVALAWVLEEPSRPIALGAFRDPGRLRAAWPALDIRLSAAGRAWLDSGVE